MAIPCAALFAQYSSWGAARRLRTRCAPPPALALRMYLAPHARGGDAWDGWGTRGRARPLHSTACADLSCALERGCLPHTGAGVAVPPFCPHLLRLTGPARLSPPRAPPLTRADGLRRVAGRAVVEGGAATGHHAPGAVSGAQDDRQEEVKKRERRETAARARLQSGRRRGINSHNRLKCAFLLAQGQVPRAPSVSGDALEEEKS